MWSRPAPLTLPSEPQAIFKVVAGQHAPVGASRVSIGHGFRFHSWIQDEGGRCL